MEGRDVVLTCRICGGLIRDGEDVVAVDTEMLHVGCVDAPSGPQRRHIGGWAAFGSRGQMAMGVTQREPPIE